MKKSYWSVALFCCCLSAAGAQQTDVQSVAGNVVEWRHHLHENPELSFKEYNTGRYVADMLRSFGNIEVVRPAETSVIGILRGAKPGRTVGFRADMDALPVQEETGFSFASKTPGVSHACGHDMHTAMLLGTAKVLSGMQEELQGTVYFIFQHAEEKSPGGALQIIKSGKLKGVDAIFGAHVIPNMPAGSIGMLPAGAASSSSDGFFLTIQGKGSHGSMPQMGVDPIVTGSEIVMMLQTVVSRNVTPGEMAVGFRRKVPVGRRSERDSRQGGAGRVHPHRHAGNPQVDGGARPFHHRPCVRGQRGGVQAGLRTRLPGYSE